MWLTMRSIRSAGFGGSRSVARDSTLRVCCCSRLAKNSRTMQSVGCTVSSTRSNNAKPTGLVSIASSASLALDSVPLCSPRNSPRLPAPAARRRKTSMSYHDV